jgi:pyruvate/2-oxoacid:ferredoxin oxidoreductase beta subunit
MKRQRRTFAISENVFFLILREMAQVTAELVGIGGDLLVEARTSANGGDGDAKSIGVVANHHLCRSNPRGQYKNP